VRAALVDANQPLVRRIAAQRYAKRIGGELEFGDFLQFGMVGLLEAIDRYSPDHGAKFETFATYRIDGAILNGITSLSEYQQQAFARRGLLQQRVASIDGADGTVPDRSTTEAKGPLERLAELAIGLALGFALEDAGMYVDGEPALPDDAYGRLELKQMRQQVAQLVGGLPEMERKVIVRHYFQQMRFDSIAEGAGLSKGRISQLHRSALERLRTELSSLRLLELRT